LAVAVPGAPRGVVELMARLAEKYPGKRGDQKTALAAIDTLLAAPTGGVTTAENARAVHQGPRLLVESGRLMGTVVPLNEGELIIGRMPGCGLVLDDARASRRHAVVAKRGTSLEVRDLGSRNGVLVNGHAVQAAPLTDGDRITVGDTLIRVDGVLSSQEAVPTHGRGGPPLATAPQVPAAADAGLGVVVQRAAAGPRQRSQVPGIGHKEVEHSREEQAGFDRLADGPGAGTSLSQHVQILYRLGKAVAAAREIEDLGGRVVDLVKEAIPFDRGFVLLEGAGEPRVELRIIASRDSAGGSQSRPSVTVLKRVVEEGVSLVTADASTDQRLELSASVVNMRIRGVMCAPMWAGDKMTGALYLERGTQRPFVAEELITLEAIADFAGTAFQQHMHAARARAASRMVEDLARFVAPEVRAELEGKSDRDVAALLGHREMNAAILFCDIQGFTPLCERLSPTDVANLLTVYFNALTDAVMEQGGSLNKFVGDACMGLFGVPLALDNNSLRAVMSGFGILRRIHELQQHLPADRKFKVRVGINTGVVVAGAFGSERRMEYTVLGDTVNVAARLESASVPMGILIGETTFNDVRGQVTCTPRGPLSVKGKTRAVNAYEIAVPGITSPPPRSGATG
jgi:adenylate cyclase